MRPWLLAPAVALCCFAPPAAAQSGGAAAPSGDGGAEHGAPATPPKQKAPARRTSALRATLFSATPTTVQPGGAPIVFTYRIDGAARRVRVRIDVMRVGERAPVARLRLGWKPTRQRRSHEWSLATGVLGEGDYQARLHAIDDAGATLRRSARASGRSAVHVGAALVRVGPGVFPVAGAWTYGGEGAAFGADRGGRAHQGQDLMAAEGTPVLAPCAGFIFWKAYQDAGAGHYLVLRCDDLRDMVFMHLRAEHLPVGKGDAVVAGQQIGEIGNTGRSSAPHLHFEIWPDGWYAKDSQPIDPRPDLDAWAGQADASPPAG